MHVILHRRFGDLQLGRDLAIAEALGQEHGDLALAFRQDVEPRRLATRFAEHDDRYADLASAREIERQRGTPSRPRSDRSVMREGWRSPIAVDGDTVRAEWTCYSPAIPGGSGHGENVFTLRDGKIVRLETRLKAAAG